MEPAKCPDPVIVLLKACCVLLFLGYGSTADDQCPLIAPLSSYAPAIHSVGPSPVTSPVAQAQLDSLVSLFIADNGIPFYAVSVVHGDQMVYSSGLTTSTFLIASVTKTFTALGALMLRERGLLSLDDPVKKFLPHFRIVNPYEPHHTTLRELMGHLSGLPRELCADTIVEGQSEAQCPVEEADVLKLLAGMELVQPPFSREPVYSNLGFALLGHSWEKATSPYKPWYRFIEEDILTPLGMNSTGIIGLDSTNVILVTGEAAADFDFGWQGPAGNMYTTATDLAKYLIFLLNAQPGLVSATTIREWTNTRTIFPDGTGGFALPWELALINATGNEFLITKGGGDPNFRSIIAIHPPTQLGFSFVFFDNDPPLPDANALMGDILNYLIPLVEQDTARIIGALYSGHYVCNATAPFFSPSYNDTVEVVGGFINIADSPSLGLTAFVNLTYLLDGGQDSLLGSIELLLKNSTTNSFWVGQGDCSNYNVATSEKPSLTDPNYPGTIYRYEIEFDLAQKTLLWPDLGAVCVKS